MLTHIEQRMTNLEVYIHLEEWESLDIVPELKTELKLYDLITFLGVIHFAF